MSKVGCVHLGVHCILVCDYANIRILVSFDTRLEYQHIILNSMNLYEVTVPGFIRELNALQALLHKAEEYVKSRTEAFHPAGMLESSLLQDKLIFDQFSLTRQIQIACDNAKLGVARIAEVEAPKYDDTESTFAELSARISNTIAFLETITPEQMVEKEGIAIGNPYWGGKEMYAKDYVVHHLIPNFYFHVTTAFSILRRNGLLIGKGDFFGIRHFVGE